MFEKIRKRCEALTANFKEISAERQLLLKKLAAYIQEKTDQQAAVQLVFVCTHNSRRSHLGQVWAAVAANFYRVARVSTFSGGTEATALHPNAIEALSSAGFVIEQTSNQPNPIYTIAYSDEHVSTCFSKLYNDAANPTSGFAAIMTCADAEENCPFIPDCDFRIGTTYHDPKAFDGSVLQLEKYQERSNQIALECLYVFSLIQQA
jgi:protein-tyrosine phosphatase/arsenate reductase